MLAVWAMQFGGLSGFGTIDLDILAVITAGLTTLAASGAVLAYFAGGDDVITAVEAAALTDAPTGLLSSAGLRSELPQYCRQVEKNEELNATYVISVEFSGLRQINEYFSDATGDRVLLSLAARLRAVIGSAGPIGRTTGGEFVVFLNTGEDLAEIHAAVNGIMRVLNQPIKVNGMIHPAYCSCGVALINSENVPFERALRSANVARANAAEAGLGTWALYHPEMGEAATYNRWLKTELTGAIDRNELSLVYQPQIDANSSKIVGYEALLRWNHWRIGAIPPADFIPVAEQSGLIYRIGEWVLRRACSNAKHIPGDVKVSINVSNLQLEQPDFIMMMEDIIKRENVDATRIELEMTESLLASNSTRVRDHLAWVKERGISVAIDDFGTGYSNLSMLAGFSFDRLKIDKSFIDRLDERGKFGPMVATIVNLAHTLGATTVAEGVENEMQATLVKAAGCHVMQGYLYGRPKPLEEVIAENDNAAPVIAIDNKIVLSNRNERLEAVV
ncbi:MAG: bifunctional diguanylate cyclase/phosphodiesterase [Pseudomonadota bacterium]